MEITLVHVHCAPDSIEAFHAASLANAHGSVKEVGNIRFDVLSSREDPTKFVLLEIFAGDALAAHKRSAHFLEWREAVQHMMAQPRRGVKYRAVFPTEPEAFRYALPPAGTAAALAGGGDGAAGEAPPQEGRAPQHEEQGVPEPPHVGSLEQPCCFLTFFDVKAEEVEAFKVLQVEECRAVMAREPGALRCDLLQEVENPTKFMVYGALRSEAALRVHQGLRCDREARGLLARVPEGSALDEERVALGYRLRFPASAEAFAWPRASRGAAAAAPGPCRERSQERAKLAEPTESFAVDADGAQLLWCGACNLFRSPASRKG